MLINGLLQQIQSSFRNPHGEAPAPLLKVVTRLYTDNSAFVLTAPVSIKTGYGVAAGRSGTFRERVERFTKIVTANFELFKKLYTVNMNEVAFLLYAYDLGLCQLTSDQRVRMEESGSNVEACGRTVALLAEASIAEQLGDSINQQIMTVTALYGRLRGESTFMADSTEIMVASNLIHLDLEAIDSIGLKVLR